MPNAASEYNSLLAIFKSNGKSIFKNLHDIAYYIFASLFLIQFVIQGSSLAIKGGDLGDFAEFIVKQSLYFGFFYWLVLNANEIGNNIVTSFSQAGQKATGATRELAPGDIIAYGINMSGHIIKNLSLWPSKIGFSILAVISAIILLMITAFMAALISLALIESYIIVGSSVLFMAFGGAVWTKDIAISMLRYAFSIGAKIFMMYIILGTSFNSIAQWAKEAGGLDPMKNISDLLTFVSLFFFILVLFIKLPEMIQAVINGSTSASTGTQAIMAAAAGVAGGAMAIGSATQLAAAQTTAGPAMQSLSGQTGMAAMRIVGNNTASATGFGLRMAGNTLRNLASSSMKDLGDHIRYGTLGGRMAVSMDDKLNLPSMEPIKRTEAFQNQSTESDKTTAAIIIATDNPESDISSQKESACDIDQIRNDKRVNVSKLKRDE